MGVKFKNQCPEQTKGYCAYKWIKPARLRAIPQMLEELFEMIRSKATAPSTAIPAALSPKRETTSVESYDEPPTATKGELEDTRALCASPLLSLTTIKHGSIWDCVSKG